MPIKEVIQYRTEDGVGHTSLDMAVAHERYLRVRDMLANDKLRQDLSLELTEIENMARVIVGTHEFVSKIFAEDMKAGVAVPRYFEGGVVKAKPSVVGERQPETRVMRKPPFGAPYAGHVPRTEGAQRTVADAIARDRLEIPDRPGGVIIDKTDDFERRQDEARAAKTADPLDGLLDELESSLTRS